MEEGEAYRYGVLVQLLILSILGIIGNAFVIAVYVRQKHTHSAVIFILTLAVTDFITCILTIPYTIAAEVVHFKLRYDFFCKLYFFLITSTVPFSAFIMTIIAVDRFLNIVGPFRFRFSVTCARIIAVCLALLAVGSGIITALMYGVQDENTGMYFDGLCMGINEILPDRAAHIWQNVYTSLYLICGVVVIILYVIIYVHVITSNSVHALFGGSVSSRRGERNQTTELRPMNQESDQQNTTDETPVIDNETHNETGNDHTCVQNSETTRPMAASTTSVTGARASQLSKTRHIEIGFMLSVVAFVYLLCFLPAWLMSHGVIRFNVIVFYSYFSYHVTNPVIYSLLSRSFRRKLFALCHRRRGEQELDASTSVSVSIVGN